MKVVGYNCKVFDEMPISSHASQFYFYCREPKLCCTHKHYYCGFHCLFNFDTLFLTFSTGDAFNSGFLSTLEPGISGVSLCRRAHATCSYSLDDKLQGELDDIQVNSFTNILLASQFHMFNKPTGPDVETHVLVY